jgi:hypothetical protein
MRLAVLLTTMVFITGLGSPSYGQQRASTSSAPNVDDCRLHFPSFAGSEHWWEALSKYLNEKATSTEIADAFKGFKPLLVKELRWLGDLGYLVGVRIQKSTNPTAHKKLLAIDFFGAGTNAVNALALNTAGPTISARAAAGYNESEEDSYYLWITRDGRGYKSECITFPAAPVIKEKAQIIKDSEADFAAFKEAERTSGYEALALDLSREMKSGDVRNRILAADQERRTALAELRSIDERLGRELDKAERASKTVRVLQTLEGVLSVAQEIGTARAELGPDAPSFEGATSHDAVLQRTREYEFRTNEGVVRLKEQRTITFDRLKTKERSLNTKYSEIGVPTRRLP